MVYKRFGFSTGALEKSDYKTALKWMREHCMMYVELSALRYEELEPLINDLDALGLNEFSYVSFHAPSAFPKEREQLVVSMLDRLHKWDCNIIVHPDVIYTPTRWQHFGHRLLIENMDRRKEMGRTVADLERMLTELPQARLCLDVAHARQMDTTLSLLWSFTSRFRNRIAEIHMSELDSHCRHRPLSSQAIKDYRKFASVLQNIPVIIESMLYHDHRSLRQQEFELAQVALDQRTEIE
jgi:hypothetical protein